jgi:hypothetical protein
MADEILPIFHCRPDLMVRVRVGVRFKNRAGFLGYKVRVRVKG